MNTISIMQRLRWIFGCCALLLFVLLCTGWFLHHELMKQCVAMFRYYGYDTFVAEKMHLTWHSVRFENVHISAEDKPYFMHANQLTASFSWDSLRARKIHTLTVDGLFIDDDADRLQSIFTDQKSIFSKKMPFFRLNVDGMAIIKWINHSFLAPIILNIDSMHEQIDLNGVINPVSTSFSGKLMFQTTEDPHNHAIQITGHAMHTIFNETPVFLKKITLTSFFPKENQEKKIVFEISEGFIDDSNSILHKKSFNLAAQLNYSIENKIFALKWEGKGVIGAQKFTFRAKNTPKTLIFSSSLTEEEPLPSSDSTGKANAEIHVPFEMPQEKSDLEPFALLSRIIDAFTYAKEKGVLSINFDDFSIKNEFLSAKNVQGALNMTFFPVKTRGIEKISCDSLILNSNIALKDLNMNFFFDKTLYIKELTMGIFDGILHVHSFQKSSSPIFSFDMKNIDIKTVLSALDIPYLSGEGRVQGKGQISYNKQKGFQILNARISSQNTAGKLKYIPIQHEKDTQSNTNEQNTSNNPDNVGFKIFKNMNYTHFSLDITPENEKTQLDLDIMGYNPEVLSGHPFHFKIKTVIDAIDALKHPEKFIFF